MGPQNHNAALVQPQHHVIDSTNSRGALNDSVEDWLYVRGRAADDTKYLGRCRLMFRGLAQLCVARFEFLEQSDVFNSNHGLRSKGLQQRKLLVSKKLHLRAADDNHTDGDPLPQQGRHKERSDTTPLRLADPSAYREPF